MSDIKKDHRLEEILMYADGALDDAERAELEEHIRGCPACQASLEEVKRFLPALQKALVPDEPSPEELLAWAKARMREKQAQPVGFFTRLRVPLVGLGLAAAAAIVIVVQPLLRGGMSPDMAHAEQDAGEGGGIMSSPHPQSVLDAGPDAGLDAGPNGGVEESDQKGGERK